VQLIVSLGVYWYGIDLYYKYKCPAILVIASVLAIFVLIVIWFSSNIFAYTYRSNQIVLSKIERKFLLCGEIVPGNWCKIKNPENSNSEKNKDKSELIDSPEIYKFFKLAAFCTGLLIVVLDLCLIKFAEIWQCIIICPLLVIIVFFALSFCWFRWGNNFLEKLLNKLKLCNESYAYRLNELKKEEEKEEKKRKEEEEKN
jgi:cell shape-determining protein MreC